MPNFVSLKAFERELGQMGKELDRAARTRITKPQAEYMQKVATRVASGDLGGDPKFSGWAPTLDTVVKPLASGATLLVPTRFSAGPWTVAELGRNQGNASGFSGPGINTRTGKTSRRNDGSLRKVRARKAKRWNGRTQPKFTATKTRQAVERGTERIAEHEWRKLVRKHFDTDG